MDNPKELVIFCATAVAAVGVSYGIYQSWKKTDRKDSAGNTSDKQDVKQSAQFAVTEEKVELPDRQTQQAPCSDSNDENLEPENRLSSNVEIDGDIGAVNPPPVEEISSIEGNEHVSNEETGSGTPDNNDMKYDIVILYAEDDYSRAQQFKLDLENKISHLNPSIVLYEEFATCGQSVFQIISSVFKRCRYLFLFVTRNFTHSQLERYQHEMALMDSIQNPEKQNRVIPIWAESGANTFLQELSILHGIEYYNPERSLNETKLSNLIITGRQNI